jgi:hypothetical protein
MSAIITPDMHQWLDVDFTRESAHNNVMMGCIPRDMRSEPCGNERAIFEELETLIPESEWDGLCDQLDASGAWLSELITRVYYQDGEPSCVSNAFCQAHEIKQCETLGPDKVVHLSQISLYQRVGSRHSGSTLSANLREIQRVGVLPLNDEANKKRFSHTFPDNGYGTKYPTGWEQTASLFKQDETVDIESYEGFVTCLLRGYPVMYARSGHCILAVKVSGRGRNRKICYVNSWGKWGAAVNRLFSYGMGLDSESVVRRVAEGAIALRSIVVPEILLSA